MIDNDFIKSHTLLECLQEFKGAQSYNGKSRLECVTEEFRILAQKFLFGGYIKVGDYYDIYIDNVEFYYHEEEGKGYSESDRITDPIVYHRSAKFPDRKLPPFPIMTLHSHQSGIDIAFEDPDGKYRASVLIREFSVIDHFNKKEERMADSRSQYLFDYLNGFSMSAEGNHITWQETDAFKPEQMFVGHRKNVFTEEYYQRLLKDKIRVDKNKDNAQRMEELDKRLWAFANKPTSIRHSNGAKEEYK